MLERIILLIDDNQKVKESYIKNYNLKIDKLKENDQMWKNYNFNFVYFSNIIDAKNYMANNIVDVIVVDYDFLGQKEGINFITHVRNSVNKQCNIIFYTMQSINLIEREELINLVNSNIYQMMDKNDIHDNIAHVIYDAAKSCNPIVTSLERFFYQYKNILNNTKYHVNGNEYLIEDIINHIRMDDDVGQVFINKLLYKAILDETKI